MTGTLFNVTKINIDHSKPCNDDFLLENWIERLYIYIMNIHKNLLTDQLLPTCKLTKMNSEYLASC